MSQFKLALARIARKITAPFLFTKRLPADFGSHKILVTSQSDIRLLAPGLNASGSDLFAVIRRLIRKDDVVWDIGSNLGIFTFTAAIAAGRNAWVYSLEADPRYADLQTRTLAQFTNDSASIRILCAAASDELGMADFAIPRSGHSKNHLSSVSSYDTQGIALIKQVFTVTLDWLLEHWKAPNFIKLDVEGAEHLALKGAQNLIKQHRPSFYLECSSENAPSLEQMFRAESYDFYTIDHAGKLTQTQNFAFNTVLWPSEKALPH